MNFYFSRYGIAGTENATGDSQKKLDVLSNDLMINLLKSTFSTCMMVSEENETAIEIPKEKQVRTLQPLGGNSSDLS